MFPTARDKRRRNGLIQRDRSRVDRKPTVELRSRFRFVSVALGRELRGFRESCDVTYQKRITKNPASTVSKRSKTIPFHPAFEQPGASAKFDDDLPSVRNYSSSNFRVLESINACFRLHRHQRRRLHRPPQRLLRLPRRRGNIPTATMNSSPPSTPTSSAAKPTKPSAPSPGGPAGKKRVVVLSSSPLDFSDLKDANVQQMSGPSEEIAATLKSQGAKHVYIDGGTTIQNFLRAGQIHRLIISRVPILIGQGVPLFSTLPQDIPLEHISTKHYPTGLVQTEYEVIHLNSSR